MQIKTNKTGGVSTMKKFASVVLSLVLFVGVSFAAQSAKTAKSSSSNSGKFAIGYSKLNINLGAASAAAGVGDVSLDQIAGRYWFNDDMGIDVTLGFRSGDAQSTVLLGGKIIGKFIKVNKLDVYWLAGLAFGSYDPKVNNMDSMTVFRIQGGVGAEFYVLPCLSVLTEMGLSFQTASGNGNTRSDFGIFADWLPQAGVRFYF